MDPLDIAILALRLALVLILYAFLVAVLRVARGELVRSRPALAAPRASDRRAPTLRLLVLDPGNSGIGPGTTLEVRDGSAIGRGPDAGLSLPDATVSIQHARVEWAGGRWTVRDLGSTNGTRVNEAAVHAATALTPGDVLGLGEVRLKVLRGP